MECLGFVNRAVSVQDLSLRFVNNETRMPGLARMRGEGFSTRKGSGLANK